MNVRPSLVATFVAALLAGAASAQKPAAKLPPFLSGATVRATVRESGSGVLTLTMTPLKGYHLYAPDPGDKFLTPTTLRLAPVPGVTFSAPTWPAPRTLGKARVYDGPVTVTWKFTAGAGAPKSAPLTLTIKAQGCNETDCFPPATFTLITTLQNR